MGRSRTRRYYKKTKKITKKIVGKIKRRGKKIKSKRYKTRKNKQILNGGFSRLDLLNKRAEILKTNRLRRSPKIQEKIDMLDPHKIKLREISDKLNTKKDKLNTMKGQLSRIITPDESAAQTEETMRKFDEAKSNLNKIGDKLNTKLSAVDAKLEEALKLQKELQSK